MVDQYLLLRDVPAVLMSVQIVADYAYQMVVNEMSWYKDSRVAVNYMMWCKW